MPCPRIAGGLGFRIFLSLAIAGLPWFQGTAAADPLAGGSLSGKVVFRGEIPRLPPKKVVSQTEVCGIDPKPNEVLQVGTRGGLGNVVVSLEGKGLRKASPPQVVKPVLDQVKCVFTPHVLLVRSGQPFLIRNSDPTVHNAHGFAVDGRYSLFNIGISPGGADQEVVERNLGGIAIRCDAGHTWMLSFIYVAPSAFAMVTDTEGNFQIEGIPPGRYRVVFWHEYLGKQEKVITISEGKNEELFLLGDLFQKPMLQFQKELPDPEAVPGGGATPPAAKEPQKEWDGFPPLRSGFRTRTEPLEDVR